MEYTSKSCMCLTNPKNKCRTLSWMFNCSHCAIKLWCCRNRHDGVLLDRAEAWEGSMLNVPAKKRIVRAWFGEPNGSFTGRGVDVTDKVRTMDISRGRSALLGCSACCRGASAARRTRSHMSAALGCGGNIHRCNCSLR